MSVSLHRGRVARGRAVDGERIARLGRSGGARGGVDQGANGGFLECAAFRQQTLEPAGYPFARERYWMDTTGSRRKRGCLTASCFSASHGSNRQPDRHAEMAAALQRQAAPSKDTHYERHEAVLA